MQNNSQEFETKPSSSKDMWLFLIVLDVIFLCVFGFFLYKHFSEKLFNAPSATTVTTVEEQLPEITEEVITVAESPTQLVVSEESVSVEEPVAPVVTTPEPTKTPVVQEPASVPAPVAQPETKESITITPTTGKYRRVTFRWFGEGTKVSVVSGFTMSKPQALKKVGDHWETTLSIAPGAYKFLYIIDGKNTLDPYAPQKDGRSFLEVK